MKHLILIVTLLTIILHLETSAQADKVNYYLNKVAQGKIEEVKLQLPELLAEYPNDPGVQLLHGVVLDDAFLAVKIYKRIISNYPESQWADDAYWRVIQFYAIMGDTLQAKEYLGKFRENYPTSEFLMPSTDIVRSSVGFVRTGTKSTAVETSERDEMISFTSRETKPAPKDKYEPEARVSEQPYLQQPKDTQKEIGPATYGLQVGLYSSHESAEAEMKRFLHQRLRTEVREKVIEGETKYAVVIGNYTSRESAEAAKQIVQQQCNCSPIVFKK